MDNASIDKLRAVLKEVKESPAAEKMDYHRMTAPCGFPCFAWALHPANRQKAYVKAVCR